MIFTSGLIDQFEDKLPLFIIGTHWKHFKPFLESFLLTGDGGGGIDEKLLKNHLVQK